MNRRFSDSTATETKKRESNSEATAVTGDSSEVEKVLKSEIEKLNDTIGTLTEKKDSLEVSGY